MKHVGFEFPIDSSGQWDGFNDPGIEHFTGNRLQHLGREVPQNTIDAKVQSPARINISTVKISSKSLPGYGGLVDAIARCEAAAGKDKSEKALKFFKDAAKLLAGKELTVLQIQDGNTTGLSGPCVNGTPFFAMLKATGQSQKPGTSTGSYGIGKFAPFAVSELRTVFVSTIWRNGHGHLERYVQGKSVLMSHIDKMGNTRRGTGFWGQKKGCLPVTDFSSDVPEWLRMDVPEGSAEGECGTKLSIIGFAATKGWQKVLAANIVENFFGAIWRGDLEVEIQNGAKINADTLDSILTDLDLGASIVDQPGEPERFSHVANYLAALKGGPEVEVACTENLHLGMCELRILVGEDMPKKVAVLRNGMLITEGLPKLKRFSDFKEFAAVLECTAEKGLALLRAMEPPRHDAFEPDRLSPDRRPAGRTALRELADWVRKMLIRFAKDPVQEETNLDELADYFGDEEEEGQANRREENPSGKIVLRARAMKIKPPKSGLAIGASPEPAEEGDSANLSNGEESDDQGGEDVQNEQGKLGDAVERDAGNARGGADPSGMMAPRRLLHSGLPLTDVRAIPIAPTKRKVAFTPVTTGELIVELQDSGTDTNYALDIVNTSAGVIDGGRIAKLATQAGVRVSIDVELAEAFAGTLRVVAHAI